MKKYNSNAEKQKAYRERRKASGRGKSELRLLMSDDAVLKLKRLAMHDNMILSEELEWMLLKREQKVLCVMGKEKKAAYYDAISA